VASWAARSCSSFRHGGPPARRAARVATTATTSCGDGDSSVMRWRRHLLVLWLVALQRRTNDSGGPAPGSPLSPSWSGRGRMVSRGPRATSPMKEPRDSSGSRGIRMQSSCRDAARGENGKRLQCEWSYIRGAAFGDGGPHGKDTILLSPVCVRISTAEEPDMESCPLK
jgi:hypothetical protein